MTRFFTALFPLRHLVIATRLNNVTEQYFLEIFTHAIYCYFPSLNNIRGRFFAPKLDKERKIERVVKPKQRMKCDRSSLFEGKTENIRFLCLLYAVFAIVNA